MTRRCCPGLLFTLALIALPPLYAADGTPAQPDASTAIPAQGLGTEPDLSGLEPLVAEQLRQARLKLADTSLPADELALRMGDLARHYLAYHLFEAAESLLARARALVPGDYRFTYHLGYTREQQGRLDEALADYRTALAERPGEGAVRFRLVRLLRQLGRLDEAAQELDGLLVDRIAAEPELAALLTERGELRQAQGRSQEAAADLSLVLAALPQANRLQYPLAMAWRALGNQEQARQAMQQRGETGIRYPDPVLDSIPALAAGETPQLLRGQTAFRAGDYHSAVELFRKAVEASPDSVRARVDFGSALAMAGDREGAREQLRAALAMQPDNETALENLAVLLIGMERYGEALEVLEEGHRRLPEEGNLAHLLARLLASAPSLALRDGPRALELASRIFAARKSPDTAETLAMAYAEAEQCDDAATIQGKILEEAGSDLGEERRKTAEWRLNHYRTARPCRLPGAPLAP